MTRVAWAMAFKDDPWGKDFSSARDWDRNVDVSVTNSTGSGDVASWGAASDEKGRVVPMGIEWEEGKSVIPSAVGEEK